MNKSVGIWTEENMKLLQEWWEVRGFTCGRIVTEYGALGYVTTRNAIIGKVHRTGLKPPEWKREKLKQLSGDIMAVRNMASKPKPEGKVIVMRRKPHSRRPTEARSILPSSSNRVLLKHSVDGQCKYIVAYGNGLLENAIYCGEPTTAFIDKNGKEVHSPWCEFHRNVCTVESRPSKYLSGWQGRGR